MLSTDMLMNIPSNQNLVFVCVGTDRSTGDAYGPLVGSFLKERYPDLCVYGTLEEPVNAVNVSEINTMLRQKHANDFVIGIDSALGKLDHVGNIIFKNGPLRPGAGVQKSLPEIGTCQIACVVNVGGFMEMTVLNNTRLSFVLQKAKETIDEISRFLEFYNSEFEVAATEFTMKPVQSLRKDDLFQIPGKNSHRYRTVSLSSTSIAGYPIVQVVVQNPKSVDKVVLPLDTMVRVFS